MPERIGTGSLCRLLGVKPYQVEYLVSVGKIVPAMQEGRRWWSRADVVALAGLLGVPVPQGYGVEAAK